MLFLACDDALLLRVEDALGAWLPEAALRRAGTDSGGRTFATEYPDERGQHVRDGCGDEDRPRWSLTSALLFRPSR